MSFCRDYQEELLIGGNLQTISFLSPYFVLFLIFCSLKGTCLLNSKSHCGHPYIVCFPGSQSKDLPEVNNKRCWGFVRKICCTCSLAYTILHRLMQAERRSTDHLTSPYTDMDCRNVTTNGWTIMLLLQTKFILHPWTFLHGNKGTYFQMDTGCQLIQWTKELILWPVSKAVKKSIPGRITGVRVNMLAWALLY